MNALISAMIFLVYCKLLGPPLCFCTNCLLERVALDLSHPPTLTLPPPSLSVTLPACGVGAWSPLPRPQSSPPPPKLAMSTISKWSEASILAFFNIEAKRTWLIPKILKIEAKGTLLIPDIRKIEAKRTLLIPYNKKIKANRSLLIQELKKIEAKRPWLIPEIGKIEAKKNELDRS